MKFEVKDGTRPYQLDGVQLAHSSSRIHNRPRWVEFSLYKTLKGQYVVYRVGQSLYFHTEDCYTVFRNKLSVVDESEITNRHIPCPDCRPSRISVTGLYPEMPRHKAWIPDSAEGVVKSLYKYDDNNTEYLTNVVIRLLEEASEKDSAIADAFLVRVIE